MFVSLKLFPIVVSSADVHAPFTAEGHFQPTWVSRSALETLAAAGQPDGSAPTVDAATLTDPLPVHAPALPPLLVELLPDELEVLVLLLVELVVFLPASFAGVVVPPSSGEPKLL